MIEKTDWSVTLKVGCDEIEFTIGSRKDLEMLEVTKSVHYGYGYGSGDESFIIEVDEFLRFADEIRKMRRGNEQPKK